jgi:hypothetical protein
VKVKNPKAPAVKREAREIKGAFSLLKSANHFSIPAIALVKTRKCQRIGADSLSH